MASKGKSGKVNRAWLNDHLTDPYVKLAKKDGYRARAAYKLKEIDEALGLVKPGQTVVDLGSAPGAWSQYLRRRMAGEGGLNGQVFALDMLPMEPVDGVHFILGDLREDAVLAQLHAALGGAKVDLVVSDMAPNLSGIAPADAARMEHLIELALEFSQQHLKTEGALVAKLFHGSGYSQLVEAFKKQFRVVKPIKPKASRDKSAETYVVGLGLKFPAAA